MNILTAKGAFNDKIVALAKGISVAEGWFRPGDPGFPEGSVSYRNHSPGNLMESYLEVGKDNAGHSIFDNDSVGYFALCLQLQRYALGLVPLVSSDKALGYALAIYTGSQDQKALENYTQTVERVSGLNRATIIATLLE